jgi:anaerobic magnesium-protoporphyrin IX monomethyl ester cyclase
MSGRRFRARSPSNVVDELQQVVEEYDFNRFVFNDDTFTLDGQRVLGICDEILQRGLDITWACSARVDTVTPELLQRLSEAGCNMIYYGVESGSQKILDNFIGKRITLEQAKNSVKWAHDAGIATVASYIIGFPGERMDKAFQSHLKKSEYGGGGYEGDVTGTVFESLVRADEIDSDLAQVHLLTPYPGTPLYDNPESLGVKILTKDFSRYNLQLPVIETDDLTSEELWSAFVTYMNEFDTFNSLRAQRRMKRIRDSRRRFKQHSR